MLKSLYAAALVAATLVIPAVLPQDAQAQVYFRGPRVGYSPYYGGGFYSNYNNGYYNNGFYNAYRYGGYNAYPGGYYYAPRYGWWR